MPKHSRSELPKNRYFTIHNFNGNSTTYDVRAMERKPVSPDDPDGYHWWEMTAFVDSVDRDNLSSRLSPDELSRLHTLEVLEYEDLNGATYNEYLPGVGCRGTNPHHYIVEMD